MKNERIIALNLFSESESAGQENASTTEEATNQFAADENAENSSVSAEDENGEKKDKTALFNEMINGEYKSEYQTALENALRKRLKTSKKKIEKGEEFRAQLTPLLERLAVKYSIENSDDINAIIEAAENDNSYYEEYAKSRGVDVEGAKELIKAKRITEENEKRIEEERLEEEFSRKFEGWLRQAEETKQKYPSFDFEYESSNDETGEQFRRLLNSGIDVESAYTLIHKSEIMGGAMKYAYQMAKQEMADARTSRSNRPDENGISSGSSSSFTDDIAKLNALQRKKIKAAVIRGEKVSADNFRAFL